MDIDKLIDQFVDGVNFGPRCPVNAEDNPPSVLIGEPDEFKESDWRIKPYSENTWIEPLESQLPFKIPAVYRSLVTRYIFPAFEFGPIFFYANTPEGSAYFEFRNKLFQEGFLSKKIINAGFLQFGNPWIYNHDQVCFDMNAATFIDAPIVQIDHEAIFSSDEVVVAMQIAPSFAELIKVLVRG